MCPQNKPEFAHWQIAILPVAADHLLERGHRQQVHLLDHRILSEECRCIGHQGLSDLPGEVGFSVIFLLKRVENAKSGGPQLQGKPMNGAWFFGNQGDRALQEIGYFFFFTGFGFQSG
jgi:hypothetical protein